MTHGLRFAVGQMRRCKKSSSVLFSKEGCKGIGLVTWLCLPLIVTLMDCDSL